jgi:DNA-binding transcriptional LysR family regulator
MDKLYFSQIARRASLRQLQVFEAIARLGSHTRAAEELYLTQPTVSLQIKRLTEVIGLPLFEQVGKRIYLTEAGRALYSACRELFDTFSRLDMQLADLQGLKRGRLKMAVVTTAKYFAPKVLGQFCRLHPGVDVSLKVTNRERLLDRMAENEDDVYILGQPPESPGLLFEPFVANPIMVFGPRDHPLASERAIDPARLALESFIMREAGSGTRMALERFFSERGIKVRASMELGSNEAIKQAVAGGLGISALSRHALAWEPPIDEIVTLDVQGFPISWHWYVGYPAGKKLSPVARAFLEYLKTEGRRLAEERDYVADGMKRTLVEDERRDPAPLRARG